MFQTLLMYDFIHNIIHNTQYSQVSNFKILQESVFWICVYLVEYFWQWESWLWRSWLFDRKTLQSHQAWLSLVQSCWLCLATLPSVCLGALIWPAPGFGLVRESTFLTGRPAYCIRLAIIILLYETQPSHFNIFVIAKRPPPPPTSSLVQS